MCYCTEVFKVQCALGIDRTSGLGIATCQGLKCHVRPVVTLSDGTGLSGLSELIHMTLKTTQSPFQRWED